MSALFYEMTSRKTSQFSGRCIVSHGVTRSVSTLRERFAEPGRFRGEKRLCHIRLERVRREPSARSSIIAMTSSGKPPARSIRVVLSHITYVSIYSLFFLILRLQYLQRQRKRNRCIVCYHRALFVDIITPSPL